MLLSIEVIERLSSGKGVRKIAVENFLGTISTDEPMREHMGNLAMDARSYGWNYATQSAIRRGIEMLQKHGL